MSDVHYLLLRGLAREARHWGEFPKMLAQVSGQNTPQNTTQNTSAASQQSSTNIICLDLPGAGKRYAEDSPVTLAETVKVLRNDFLREKNRVPDAKWVVVAISLGGMVAVEWARQFPEDFQAMVLINTSFKGFSPMHERLWWPAYPKLLKIFLNMHSHQKRELAVLEMVSNRPANYQPVSELFASYLLDQPFQVKNFFRQIRAALSFDPPESLPAKLALLVINSVQDRMVKPTCSEEIQRRWRCTFLRHPDAGHDLPLDDPQWLSERIHAWVGSQDSLK